MALCIYKDLRLHQGPTIFGVRDFRHYGPSGPNSRGFTAPQQQRAALPHPPQGAGRPAPSVVSWRRASPSPVLLQHRRPHNTGVLAPKPAVFVSHQLDPAAHRSCPHLEFALLGKHLFRGRDMVGRCSWLQRSPTAKFYIATCSGVGHRHGLVSDSLRRLAAREDMHPSLFLPSAFTLQCSSFLQLALCRLETLRHARLRQRRTWQDPQPQLGTGHGPSCLGPAFATSAHLPLGTHLTGKRSRCVGLALHRAHPISCPTGAAWPSSGPAPWLQASSRHPG